MAESTSPMSQAGASGAGLHLSQKRSAEASPPECTASGPSLACEDIVQNCCEKGEQCLPGATSPANFLESHSPVHTDCGGLSCTRTIQCLTASSLPVTRSHSDSLSLLKQEPTVDKVCTLVEGSCTLVEKEAESTAGGSVLVCKRPMQLQQCNMVTTICRGALSTDITIPQPCQGTQGPRTSCLTSPKIVAKEEPPCDRAFCYGSYFHHTNLEDTFASYCHPQPILAPSQLLPPLSCLKGPSHLNLPRLMSSVSETGLDAKHVACCCQLGCSRVSPLQQPQRHPSPVRGLTRDMGTMTVSGGQRDVGVQTAESITHVFPEVCLVDESHRDLKTNTDTGQKTSSSKSPVKEVKWDAEGMTWEVYGASVDPEELGLAIQRHLELQIKETASRAAKLSRQNTNTSRTSGSMGCQRKRSRFMGSLRPPACCARSTTVVD